MSSTAYDLGFLIAGIQEIEAYLLSKSLFWPLSTPSKPGESGYPRLTLGNLLLSKTRLKSKELSHSQSIEIQSLEKQLDHWRIKWRIMWERKACHEFDSRLRQWGHFLDEIIHKPELNIPFFVSEVRLRVLIELLKLEINSPSDHSIQKLSSLDGFLKSIFVPGEFIWADELESGFDRKIYWYLWGLPEI